MKVAVIGGGIFGVTAALQLSEFHDVILFEKEKKILSLASKFNQNRIHYGYHYPRSKETAKQSLEGLLSFVTNFSQSIVGGFENYYAIASDESNVTSSEFYDFCKELGISSREASPSSDLLNRDKIDVCYKVNEPVFDYNALASELNRRLVSSSVRTKFEREVSVAVSDTNEDVMVLSDPQGYEECFDYVINATYANVNSIQSSLPVKDLLDLRFQYVVLPVFEFDRDKFGITIMDGPFCSVLPEGNNQNKFILSNVKFSPVTEQINNKIPIKELGAELQASIENIYGSSSEFFPFLKDVKHVGEYKTIKAISTCMQDSRVSDIHVHTEYPRLITILSGKVTTAWPVAYKLSKMLGDSS